MSEEQPPPRERPRRRWVKPLAWIGGALGVVVLLLVGLVFAIDTDAGHGAIARYLRGYQQANGMQIRVGGIEGSIYGRMVLRDLELRDPQGVFLTSPAVTVDWRPTRLLSNHLMLREASSPLLRILRQPALRPTPPRLNQPLLPSIDITVDQLDLRQIVLEAPVTGRRQVAAVAGNVDLRDGRARLGLRALTRPHDGVGGGDRLVVNLDAAPEANRLQIDARLTAPTGGVVDGLTGLGRPVALQVSGAGTWAQWTGRAVGQLGGQGLLDLALGARDGRFTVSGNARPALLVTGNAARLLQPIVRLDLAGTLRERRLQADLRARSSAIDITGRGLLDLARSRFGDFRVEGRLLQPGALMDNVGGRDVRLSVALDGAFATPRVDYRLQAARIGFGETVVEELAAQGRFTVGRERTVAPIRATAARVLGVDEAVGGILRNMRMDGDLVITNRQIATDNLRIRSDRLDATLVFAFTFATGQYTAALKGEINRYEVPGVGVFNLITDARLVPAPNGQFSIRGNVRVQSVRIDNAGLRDALGGPLTAVAVIERTADGLFVINSLRVTSPKLQVTDGRGRLLPNGQLAFTATVRSQQYGVYAVAAQGTATRPLVRVRSSNPTLPVPLSNLDVTLRPDRGGYVVTATAISPYGPLAAEVALQLGRPLSLDVRRASLAGINVTGRLQQTASGPFAGALNLQGAGLSGALRLGAAGTVQQVDFDLQAQNARIPLAEPLLVARGTARGTATLFPNAPAVVANASLSGVRSGGFTANEATARLNYRGGSGRLELTAAGRSGATYSVAATADLAPNLISVDARGTVNTLAIRLQNPARIQKVGAGWRLQPTTVLLPDGRVQIAASTGNGTRLAARLQALDLEVLRAFAPDLGIDGTASGTIDVALPAAGGQPTGRIELNVSRLTRTGLSTMSEPVDIAFVGAASGASIDGNAVVRRRSVVVGRMQARLSPIPATGASLMDRLLAAPLQGGIRYNGPSEVLWGLTGMAGQEVTGPIAVGADISGRLGQPRTTGVIRGRGLRYENQAYGTVVDNLAVEARLDGSRLEFANITGRAGRGTLTGNGFINLAADEGFPMDLRLRLDRAQLARSDTLSAVLTGPIAITNSRERGALITGEVDIEDARYRIARQGAADVVELTGVRRRGEPIQPRRTAEAGTGLPTAWRLDIGVRSDNRIYVSGMGLDSEWQASLRVQGVAARPSIVGDIRVTRGTFNFAGRRLTSEPRHHSFCWRVAAEPDPRPPGQHQCRGRHGHHQHRRPRRQPADRLQLHTRPAAGRDPVEAAVRQLGDRAQRHSGASAGGIAEQPPRQRRWAQSARVAPAGGGRRPAADPGRGPGQRPRRRRRGGQVHQQRRLCGGHHRRPRLHRHPAGDRAQPQPEPAVAGRLLRRHQPEPALLEGLLSSNEKAGALRRRPSRYFVADQAPGRGGGICEALRTRPSSKVALTNEPPFSPLFSGLMTTFTLSPAFSVVRFQPRRASPFGLPPSTDHSSIWPWALRTLTWTQVWGLVHWNSLTVPSSVTFFELSNIANEWCADAGAATSNASPATPSAKVLRVKPSSICLSAAQLATS